MEAGMARYEDRVRSLNSGWRWKPVDLVLLVVGFAVWWPFGLSFLVWKLWNDRRAQPYEVEDILQRLAGTAQDLIERVAESWRAPALTPSEREVTGNAAFDAYVRERLARLNEDRRSLDAEIEAFRAHLAHEKSGDGSVYERFRASYGEPR